MIFTPRHALLGLMSLGFLSVSVDSLFFNTINGFATDVKVNPLGVIAAVLLKKLILSKLLVVGKRSVDMDLPIAPGISSQDPQVLSSGDYEQLATRFDVNGCLAKLVCEVVATQNGTSRLEKSIIKYFGQEPNPDVTDDLSKGSSIFHYAAFMGKVARGPESCSLVFPSCARSNDDVRKVAETVFELDL